METLPLNEIETEKENVKVANQNEMKQQEKPVHFYYNDDDDGDGEEFDDEGFIFEFSSETRSKHAVANQAVNIETEKQELVRNEHSLETDERNEYETNRNSLMRENIYETREEVMASELRRALVNGNMETVRHIFDSNYEFYDESVSDQPYKMDVNYVFADTYWTPLMVAASEANIELTKYLIEQGASCTYADDSFTVMMCACGSRTSLYSQADLVNVVELLFNNGAQLDNVDKYFQTPLIYAARAGNDLVVEFLIKHQVNINATDDNDWTALAHASHKGHLKTVVNLLKAKADPFLFTSDYLQPHDLAENAGFLHITLLIENYIKVGKLCKKYKNQQYDQNRLNCLTSDSENDTEYESEANDKPKAEIESFKLDDELVRFLHALNLNKLKKHFISNRVTMKDLLIYGDDDLKFLGITDKTTRKLILNESKKIHHKSWCSSSLIPLRIDDRLNCAEATAIVSNISKQIDYMESNLKYVQLESSQTDSIIFTDDFMTCKLSNELEKCIQNLKDLLNVAKTFDKHVKLNSQRTKSDQYPIDYIDYSLAPIKRHRFSISRKFMIATGCVAATLGISALIGRQKKLWV